jgi:hypothetical protein
MAQLAVDVPAAVVARILPRDEHEWLLERDRAPEVDAQAGGDREARPKDREEAGDLVEDRGDATNPSRVQVTYEDGSQRSNRRVPAELLGPPVNVLSKLKFVVWKRPPFSS